MQRVAIATPAVQAVPPSGIDALARMLRSDGRVTRMYSWKRQPAVAELPVKGAGIATTPGVAGSPIGTTPTVRLTAGQTVVMPAVADRLVTLLDSATGTAGVGLQTRTPDSGGGLWTRHPNFATGSIAVTDVNRLRSNIATTSLFYAPSGAADTTDMEADFVRFAANGAQQTMICLCVDPTSTNLYGLRYFDSTGNWDIIKYTAGSPAILPGAQSPMALTNGVTYHPVIRKRGGLLIAEVNGVEVARAVDASPYSSGRPGLLTTVASTNTSGTHLDNLRASQPTAKTFGVGFRATAFGPVLSLANTVGSDGWTLSVEGGALVLREYGYGGTVVRTLSGGSVALATDHYAEVVWDALDGAQLWLDGGLVAFGGMVAMRYSHPSAVLRAGGSTFAGDIGTIAALDAVLTPADHQNHADAARYGRITVPAVTNVVPIRYCDAQRGSNANDGLTDATPWATTAFAFTNAPDHSVVYLSGDFSTGGTTVIANGDRTRKAWVTMMPHPSRAVTLVTPGQAVAVRSSNWWRLMNFTATDTSWSFDSISSGVLGSKFYQLIGIRGRAFFARKSQYGTISWSEFTGQQAAAKGMMFQGNLDQVAGWIGHHNILLQDVWTHDHFGDGFGSYECMRNLTIRRMRVENIFKFGSDHADGLQIESPMGMDVDGLVIKNVNGSGGALFLAQTLLVPGVPKAGIRLRNVGLFGANTNGIVIGAGTRVFLEHLTAYGTTQFSDLKIAGVQGGLLVNSLIGKMSVTGTNVITRTNNVVSSFDAGALAGGEVIGNPTFLADGQRLSLASAVGRGIAAAKYGPYEIGKTDFDGNSRIFPADAGFTVAA